jgi:peptidyl-dipeptidase Dcp
MSTTLSRRLFTLSLLAAKPLLFGSAAALLSDSSAAFGQATENQIKMKSTSAMLEPWPGPFGGVPPWNLVRVDEFNGAFDEAIRMADEEVEAIANNPQPPALKNTVIALETVGRTLERVETLFDVHTSNLNVGPIPDIERVVAPKLSEHADRIIQNEKLFRRLEAVHQSDDLKSATAAQRRLVEERYKDFVRKGAKLQPGEKAKLSQINMRLARLFADFSQNVLEDEKRYVTWIDNPADLAGLPESVIAALAGAAAEQESPKGRWAVTNTRSSMDPFLTYAENRGLRETVWRKYYSRADNDDEFDNKGIIREILDLRLRRAQLLGYESHAHWRMDSTMAKTPDTATELMMKVWPKAVARVREEVADMQAIADREAEEQGREKITIEPWDYRFYAEKVRKDRYDLDFNEVKPYLQLEKLREAMMWVSGELFGLQFRPIADVPVFHPDVRVWEVTDKNGKHVGLWYLDPYARAGKRSGAWMNQYRSQERVTEPISAIVSNNSNFIKGGAGETVLISWDDAVTLFHEFGHALHGLLSDVEYPSQAGTNVARDYVEFPSQLFEHWLSTPEVLEKFALHVDTGKPMPADLLEKIKKAANFNQGFATVEYLASALVDMRLHTRTKTGIDPAAFERETLAEIGMPSEIVMRHRMPHFSHLFSSDSYSAGYYSYLWSDALTADAAEVFVEAGSFYDADVAKSLRDNVLSVGDTIKPAEGYRRFRGRDVDTSALLRKRGFPVD